LTAAGWAGKAPRPVPSSLAALNPGDRVRVAAVGGAGGLMLRLLEMGFVPGTAVQLIKRAPFGDPLEFQVRGCHVSLRAAEAAQIAVVPA
jgi:Fe2+ transport system protein FeoA